MNTEINNTKHTIDTVEIEAALVLSQRILDECPCNKQFKDFIKREISSYANKYFSENSEEFKAEFFFKIEQLDECSHISYISALFFVIRIVGYKI